MKRRTTLVLVLVVLAIVATGALAPVLAASRRSGRVTGTVKYTMTLFDGTIAPAWATFYVTELDRATGAASGRYTWWTAYETPEGSGEASMTVDINCVTFKGSRVAEFSGQVLNFENWPPELQSCVHDVKIWVRDRGARDQVGFYVSAEGPCAGTPGFLCDPCDAENCGPGELVSFAVEEGNLRIRR